jgi:outer membrane receptor protein involved in Fe transport
MTATRTKSWLLATAGLAACLSTPALAQQAEPGVTTVDEIIVTLQKREQSIIEVPTALTAYSGEFLNEIGVEDFNALGLFTPGFDVQDQSPNNPGFVMRGITSDSGEAYIEPRVSVFQDGVSISKARGSYVELFDIERVELAKGPQSTLFGRGALIGAVNIIQNKASLAGFEAELEGQAGSRGVLQFGSVVNAPLSDTLAARLSFRHRQRDGSVENALGGEDFNGVDTSAARLSLLWQPADSFRADLILNYQRDGSTGTSFKARSFLPTDPATGAVLGSSDPWEPAALRAGQNFVDGSRLGLDRQVHGATAILRWDLSDSVSLTSITAARTFDSVEVFDPDGISLPILTIAEDATGDQFSQELRLNYDAGGRFRAFVGAGYFEEDGSQRLPLQWDERATLALLTGQLNGAAAGTGFAANRPAPLGLFGNTAFTGALVQGLVAASSGNTILLPSAQAQAIAANLRSGYTEIVTNSADLQSFDVFADVSFDVTDRLEVGAGVRFTSDEKTSGIAAAVTGGQRSVLGSVLAAASIRSASLLGALAAPNAGLIPFGATYPVPTFGLFIQPTTGGAVQTQSLEDDGFTWRLTARYELDANTSVYANYARGRRPAVLSPSVPTAPPLAAPTGGQATFRVVDEETVDSFEVGYKAANLLDGTLRFETAAFYYGYENFQTQIQQGAVFITTNAGEATSYGVELQTVWTPLDMLDVFATYAYNRSRFDVGRFDGNRFRLSPDHQVSVGTSARFALAGGELRVTPTYTWQSEVFFDDNNDIPALQGGLVPDRMQDEVQDGYGLLNLRLAFTPADANWSVEAFGNNLLDEQYFKDAGNTGDALGLATFIAGAPTTWGVGLSLRY